MTKYCCLLTCSACTIAVIEQGYIYVSCKKKNSFSFTVSASATIEGNSIVVKEGQDMEVVGSGSGLPSPNISWVNVSNVVMANGRIVSLHNISRTMTGRYICTARNSCGNDHKKVDIVIQCESPINY